MKHVEELNFLEESQVREIAHRFGTPVFVYSEELLRLSAKNVAAFPNAYGLTPRFAMKAAPSKAILEIFSEEGLAIDASSGFEAQRAILAGIPAKDILITSQQYPQNLAKLTELGCEFNATSIEQLQKFVAEGLGPEIGIRFNPGLGSGGTKRTNTGGPAASFGIWHETLPEVVEFCRENKLLVKRIHTHIGSGSDPDVWQSIAKRSIALLEHFPDARVLNLGGGFKVGRMSYEESTDLNLVGKPIVEEFRAFAEKTGREIRLEVEPGTYLSANCGSIISRIQSVKHTGKEGYKFYIVDAGLTEIARPAMFGAQHPLVVVPANQQNDVETEQVVVAGHCCESGDMLTPADGDPELLLPRELKCGLVDDFLVVEGAGAYTSGYCFKNYNSFPEVSEVLLRLDGSYLCIREQQTLAQMLQNERSLYG